MNRLGSLTVSVVGLLVASTGGAVEPGSIDGRVLLVEDGSPIPYANVLLLGTHLGAMTNENGAFAIENIRPGTYEVKVEVICHGSETQKVTVAPSEVSRLEFHLPYAGISSAQAAAESVGVDVHVSAEEVGLSIQPDFDVVKIGQRPEFRIALWNRSDEAIVVGDLSRQDKRCPRRVLTLTGPPGGVRRAWGEGWETRPSFVDVAPGDSTSAILRSVETCLKPGWYLATFTYSATSYDIRDWISCFTQRVDGTMSATVRRAAMVELEDSVRFEVVE